VRPGRRTATASGSTRCTRLRSGLAWRTAFHESPRRSTDGSTRRRRGGRITTTPSPSQETAMDANVKKTVLRMIPYGLYVLTAKGKDNPAGAPTVHWVRQASFAPPWVGVGVKTDSHAHALINDSKVFALNMLGKGQQAMAFTFFKPAVRENQPLWGEPFRWGSTGAPVLDRP